MALDPNIILQAQAPQLQSPLDAASKMMALKNVALQNQSAQMDFDKKNALNDALKANTSVDANGNVTYDRQGAMSALAQKNPGAIPDLQSLIDTHGLDQLKKNTEIAKNISWSISDEPSYQAARAKSIQLGLPNADKIPEQYDPDFVKNWQMHTLSGEEQLKAQETQARIADTSENRKARLQMAQQSADDRKDKQSADAYQKASHDLNTFRGNSAVQQASSALTNVQNALSLANKGNLSPDQLHLFASEMGKLATGGVPGHSEIQSLIPDTAKSRLASAISFFSNNPTDAQAQAFINNNKQYLNELADNYQGVVDKYRDNIMDGYKKKLSKSDLEDLKTRYPKAAPLSQQNQGAGAAPVSAQTHPEAQTALQWAKQNPNDPQAQEIMRRLGQ